VLDRNLKGWDFFEWWLHGDMWKKMEEFGARWMAVRVKSKLLFLRFRNNYKNYINEKTNYQYFSIKHHHYACIMS
jgi:hypothetical protein